MAQKQCVSCEKKAVIKLGYGPHSFCKEHFLHFFEKRVRKTIRENGLIKGREKIVVAYSGGKDSAVTLFLLNKIFGKSNKRHLQLQKKTAKNGKFLLEGFSLTKSLAKQWLMS